MTDLDATAAGSRGCPSCGAQVSATDTRCPRCGSDMAETTPPDAGRGDLELEEVWRAASVEGYDTDFRVKDGRVSCSSCGGRLDLRGDADHWWTARDTPTDRSEVMVAALRCPHCGTAGRAELDADVVQSMGESGAEVDPSETTWRHPPPEGATPERPLGEDRHFFLPGGPGTLAERGSLLDEDGEDIRQYTGEPVETEEGWVVPQQQNVGPGNEAGGGEWPDPSTPSAMPKDD
jgi:Zn finger protein HypA/HybF involved in hydrogenase expression